MHDPPNGLGPIAHVIFLQAPKYEATHIFANLRIGGFGSGLLLNHLIKFALLPTPQSSFGGMENVLDASETGLFILFPFWIHFGDHLLKLERYRED